MVGMSRSTAVCGLLGLLAGVSVEARTPSSHHPHHPHKSHHGRVAANPISASLSVDVSADALFVPSPTLWGIFYEDINHAGPGGLYAELINNRNFGGVDYYPWTTTNPSTTQLSIDSSKPLNYQNTQSLRVDVAPNQLSVISNPGFWGMNIAPNSRYNFSFYIQSNWNELNEIPLHLNVTLESAANPSKRIIYAAENIVVESSALNQWTQYSTVLSTGETGGNGYLRIALGPESRAAYTIFFDMVSLMPIDNLYKGLPIRADLANMIADLKPTFVRFPGGCFVEGDRLADRYNWKKAIGSIESRPGHWNLWGYFDEDGLSYFEFLSFIETLQTPSGGRVEPVWVVNNGVSHDESIPVSDIQPWVQDALDSIEFAMGAPTSKWGSIRAEMGHPEPFNINYVAIGNEDCGKPWYNENYKVFYDAFQKNYPHIRLIANCDMTSSKLPTQLWDYHVYQSPSWFFSNTQTFDNMDRSTTPKIFNSEYAVTSDCGHGNLQAAVSEAAWMIGLERNSDLVEMASYAPLLVNNNDRRWNPDAIVFDATRAYGTPSYWVQQLFSNAQAYVKALGLYESTLTSSSSKQYATATVGAYQNDSNRVLVIKYVNGETQPVNLNVNVDGDVTNTKITVETLTSAGVNDENSFDNPTLIVPKKVEVPVSDSSSFSLNIASFSVNVIRFEFTTSQ